MSQRWSRVALSCTGLLLCAAPTVHAAAIGAVLPEIVPYIAGITSLMYGIGLIGCVYEAGNACFKVSGRLWNDAIMHGSIAVVMAVFMFAAVPRITAPAQALASPVSAVVVEAVSE